MSKKEDNEKRFRNSETVRALAQFSHIGVVMAASVFIGVQLGHYIDRLLGSSPWFTIIFSMLGVGAAIKSVFEISSK